MERESTQKPIIKCAVYTRKSTAEGLDKDFTSLDAQRESAINFINSQKNEGWVALEDRYDDGGFTGANTDRPALQRLIEDIKAGKINCVVVYKVDRLSRSLVDFVQILELFEQQKVAFVSVTQAFNTNSSMGRLTLNILLSFAQFEREIISERTKDKMAAARKRGKWLGGRPPFGYDVAKDAKKLVINPEEAKIVKLIFELYLQGYSLKMVAQELNKREIKTKAYTSRRSNRTVGGNIFQDTTLNNIIRNPIYIGKVKQDDVLYDGQHEAIIDEQTFKKAIEALIKNRNYKELTRGNKVINPLTKLLYCKKCGRLMIGAHSLKHQKIRYKYYVCAYARKFGYQKCPARSISGREIETAVAERLFERPDVAAFKEKWQNMTAQEQKAVFITYIKRIEYDAEALKLIITFVDGITKEYDLDLKGVRRYDLFDPKEDIKKEPILRQNLILAHEANRLLETGQAESIKQIAKWLHMSSIHLHLLMELLYISPRIQEKILLEPKEVLDVIPEYKVHRIAKEPDWGKQYDMWRSLSQAPAN